MKKKTLICAFALFGAFQIIAQNTVGLVEYQPSFVNDGYNLVYPMNQPNVYLLNSCGEIVNQWDDAADVRPGNTAYLLEDGRLVVCKRPLNNAGDAIGAGGLGETVEIRDWDNNLEWTYSLNNDTMRLHHDIAISERDGEMTIMMIAWESISNVEAAEEGRDTSANSSGYFWPDYILEINPVTDSIVWEWHALDHLIQDFDATKNNFGVVANHPELIDVNINASNGNQDWMHCNSIDYNKTTDQVLLSVPFFDEIWIIDHSTTIAEAAGHSGGNSGKGGDLLFRWGNPIHYDNGTAADQTLFNQHDVNWIDNHLPTTDSNYGKLSIFNNQMGSNYSAGVIITPNFDSLTYQYAMTGNTWEPMTYDAVVTHPTPTNLFSGIMSSFQILENGNYFLFDGINGHTYEITPDSNVVWEYIVPLQGGSAATQGQPFQSGGNSTFRLDRYPLDYGAFTNRDLSPDGWIENNPNMMYCDSILNIENTMCIDDRNVNGLLWRDGTFAASDRIFSDSQQQTNTDVTFRAAGELNLESGFEVKLGATFHAFNQECIPNFEAEKIAKE